MSPIWTSSDVDLLLLRLSSGSWRHCVVCRRCLEWRELDLLNWSLQDRIGPSWPGTVLPEDREPAFLVMSSLLLRSYGFDLPC
ncbi:hypothetical protein TNCV_4319241 [Trichonephila clavipes]|nr:hypothetical protein TNCV_4319241 [Trichonephila clavipes]